MGSRERGGHKKDPVLLSYAPNDASALITACLGLLGKDLNNQWEYEE